MLGVRPAQACEQHVCPNDCCRFLPLHPSQWEIHANDQCPVCEQRRFRVAKRTTRSLKLAPQKRFWYRGLQNVISEKMFADPVQCALRREAPSEDSNGFHQSAEWQRLNNELGGA